MTSDNCLIEIENQRRLSDHFQFALAYLNECGVIHDTDFQTYYSTHFQAFYQVDGPYSAYHEGCRLIAFEEEWI